MKNASFLAVVATVVACALPASAQCPASMATSDPGAEPISLVLKYSWKLAETKPTALKTALEKLPTVVRTAFDDKAKNQILVKFKGKCDQVAALESAAAAAGVPAYVINHAHVAISLKGKPGGDLKAVVEAIGKMNGALYTKPSATGVDLHADLNKLDIVEIHNTVALHKFEAVVTQTYEYVRYRVVEGSIPAFQAAAENVKGVMVIREEADSVVGMWLNKAAVKAEQIEKIEGFTLKRQ